MQTTGQGHVRIIAGTLRGSKLPVLVRAGLRPTADRTRETLFNWLAMKIAGRRVLDAFSGSGALGFEAASRGAAEVVLLERDAAVADSLCASRERLKISNMPIIQIDALSWLAANREQRFDGVFLDPPFASGLWADIWLQVLPVLAEGAWVYVEVGVDQTVVLPAGLHLLKSGKSRNSKYLLAKWHKPAID